MLCFGKEDVNCGRDGSGLLEDLMVDWKMPGEVTGAVKMTWCLELRGAAGQNQLFQYGDSEDVGLNGVHRLNLSGTSGRLRKRKK